MKIIGYTYISGKAEMILKGDSALLVNRKPFFVPEESVRIAAHPCLVVRVSKLGKSISPRFAHRYFDGIAAGLHFQDEGLLEAVRKEGRSWTAAVAYDGSSPVGTFLAADEETPLPDAIRFTMDGEEKTVVPDMETISRAIADISRCISIRQGDMIFLCNDQAPFYPAENQYITGAIKGEENLYCKIK